MSMRIPLGGGDKQEESRQHYTEGYNAGYTHAMDEMRRRSRGHMPDIVGYAEQYDIEDRRGRRRGRGEMPMDDGHWPVEGHQIGFGIPHEDRRAHGESEMAMLLDMMHEVKEGQKQLQQGMASSMKKLDPRLVALLETATGVLEEPPSTWAAHMKDHDYAGIAKMEGKELLTALEEHKPVKDIRKELSHTLAALMQLAIK